MFSMQFTELISRFLIWGGLCKSAHRREYSPECMIAARDFIYPAEGRPGQPYSVRPQLISVYPIQEAVLGCQHSSEPVQCFLQL